MNSKDETTSKSLAIVNKQISKELEDPHIVKALLATTFKDFEEQLMRRAIFEGVIRGFTFKNFLQKDVYAIKYHDNKKGVDTYSLVTSIDFARKIAQKNGVWQSRPEFELDDGSVISCTVTAHRRIGQDVAAYPATVFFEEYTTDRNLWQSKPRTMIAKVAEMHALRKACPEEMAKMYTEEEFDKEKEDNEILPDDAVVTSTGDDTNIDGKPLPANDNDDGER